MDLEDEKRLLLGEMKSAKGSRFNAAERLGRRDRQINQMIAFISGCVIIVTLLPLYFHLGSTPTSVVSFATIAFSVFILAMSLLQYSNADPVRAEQHHRCGLEINALRRELRATQIATGDELLRFSRRYDETLQKYSINHETVDFERYKLEHPNEFPDMRQGGADTEPPDLWVERWVRSAGVLTASLTLALIAASASSLIPYAIAFIKSVLR